MCVSDCQRSTSAVRRHLTSQTHRGCPGHPRMSPPPSQQGEGSPQALNLCAYNQEMLVQLKKAQSVPNETLLDSLTQESNKGRSFMPSWTCAAAAEQAQWVSHHAEAIRSRSDCGVWRRWLRQAAHKVFFLLPEVVNYSLFRISHISQRMEYLLQARVCMCSIRLYKTIYIFSSKATIPERLGAFPRRMSSSLGEDKRFDLHGIITVRPKQAEHKSIWLFQITIHAC